MPRGKKRADDEPETEQAKKFRKKVDDGADEFLCPITQALPVDPVMAEDGRVYERSAIAKWLEEKQTSPLTNEEMGTKLIPALQVKNMIKNMIDADAWTGDKCEAWRLKFKQDAEVEATRKKAEAGDVKAMLQLVDWYGNGKNGLAEDPALRFAWAQRAADLDDPEGLYELSHCYHCGYGTKVNEGLHIIKLVQTAMLGHVEAMHDLMVHHYVIDELAEALYWAKRGVKETRMVGCQYYRSCLRSFVPVLEKAISQQRS
jgi:hypothetical protein